MHNEGDSSRNIGLVQTSLVPKQSLKIDDSLMLISLFQLKSLNLRIASADEIIRIMSGFVGTQIRTTVIGKGYYFYRASKIDEEEKITKSRLSYRAPKNCHFFQRASIPGESAFYSTLSPYNAPDNTGVFSALCETSPLLREGYVGDEIYAVSRWCNKVPIEIVKLYDPDDINSPLFLSNYFDSFNDAMCTDSVVGIQWKKYLYENFTRRVNRNESYRYKVSAFFSHLMMRAGADGLMWKSRAFNPMEKELHDTVSVAIAPRTIESKFEVAQEYWRTHLSFDGNNYQCSSDIKPVMKSY